MVSQIWNKVHFVFKIPSKMILQALQFGVIIFNALLKKSLTHMKQSHEADVLVVVVTVATITTPNMHQNLPICWVKVIALCNFFLCKQIDAVNKDALPLTRTSLLQKFPKGRYNSSVLFWILLEPRNNHVVHDVCHVRRKRLAPSLVQ